ncbi:MAG TPA: 30S ribosomal protein S9 [Smithellaceae bacterium]|jgi:small subunit ribosomal protein S9|nr:30S ribosomal protein S9 [Syntrophaceae bacterium]NMD05001.1 30S ribosomal protein S9 [Deltaproteobacteria bacterium]OPZ53444.1 MAG: 30S ribosomal protein S9 [Deltaproteobacteria bacterium ADurb.BinA014]HNQ17682.1 30S ribosomal protein S9 [Smithellaceae bacterium]MBP8608472.1 30S ribosomal protein S9 [Syntrophaceae bacterium]
MSEQRYYATGKRKSAIARVYMKTGSGNIVVNKRNFDEYFTRPSLKMVIKQPLEITGKKDQFDFYVNVIGGGVAGQAGAVKHGISKALLEYDAELRPILKKAGFLTRDARVKERKKYGQPGARKRFQFSKR